MDLMHGSSKGGKPTDRQIGTIESIRIMSSKPSLSCSATATSLTAHVVAISSNAPYLLMPPAVAIGYPAMVLVDILAGAESRPLIS